VSFLPLPEDPVGEGLGHFVGTWRIDAFRPKDEFKKDMDIWIERFRNAKTTENQEKVLIPGDPEREFELDRRKNGIPLLDKVIQDLSELGDKMGVPFPG
jgi:LDH2 family malate/lactate/ureidoglycolate dehydrogenase